jgi:methylene-tetrahydromethanopterin dehydrogenase
LLKKMLESDQALFLHFEHAFEVAREFIKSAN